MAFHRLTTPTYFIAGGGPLPSGYDYINNAISGTPANADSAKVGGPNAGTYFIAFGEDATSLDANRPNKALAQNCDYLDDLLRRDLAIPAQTADVLVSGSPTTSITITGADTWLGSGTFSVAAAQTAFKIVDENENEIIDSLTGSECLVTAIGPDLWGSGFSTGSTILTITPGIPVGKYYHVKYATHGNLATMPVDALTKVTIKIAEQVPAELSLQTGAALVGYAGSGTWNDGTTNPPATVEAQLDKIISDLSATAGSAKLGCGSLGAWADTTTLNTGQLYTNLTGIVTALGGSSGYARLGAGSSLGVTWNDATSVAGTTLKDFLADLVGDLAGSGVGVSGALKVGSSATLGTWADATVLASGSAWSQINSIVGGLGGTTGTARVGGAAVSGSPYSLTNGAVSSQLVQIVSVLNSLEVFLSATSSSQSIGTATTVYVFSGCSTLILPNPATRSGLRVKVVLVGGTDRITGGTPGALTFQRYASENINGAAASLVVQALNGAQLTVISDGINWTIIGDRNTPWLRQTDVFSVSAQSALTAAGGPYTLATFSHTYAANTDVHSGWVEVAGMLRLDSNAAATTDVRLYPDIYENGVYFTTPSNASAQFARLMAIGDVFTLPFTFRYAFVNTEKVYSVKLMLEVVGGSASVDAYAASSTGQVKWYAQGWSYA